jgi:uncharacterized protein YgiB involved in biofilm formation
MHNFILAVAIVVAASVTISGCKNQKRCATDDSAAVCKEVQKCFQSGTSVEVCREGEKEANAIESTKKHP